MEQNDRPVIVVKYGGSSLAKPENFHEVAEHQLKLYNKGLMPVYVNSARKGVTDRLLGVWKGEKTVGNYLKEEMVFYENVFRRCDKRDEALKRLKNSIKTLENVVPRPNNKTHERNRSHRESYAIAHGEKEAGLALSYLTSGMIGDMETFFSDGFEAGVVALHMRGPVDVERSVTAVKRKAAENPGKHLGFGGFVGRHNKDCNRYCLLDRNSTDVTAALVAAALGAKEYWNIKDVAGVYAFDPVFLEKNEQPVVIEKLSYDEAANITRSGAAVIHPMGIKVSKKYKIPIRVTSMVNGEGTVISEESDTTAERPYAAMSLSIQACITVADEAMDVPGIGRGYLHQAAGSISDGGFDILHVADSGNEMSFTVADGSGIKKDRRAGIDCAKSALVTGLRKYGRHDVEVSGREIGMIMITGRGMKARKGTLHELTGALLRSGISIAMISQSDENSKGDPAITIGVARRDYEGAVRALKNHCFSNLQPH
jgi:aspartate kinase